MYAYIYAYMYINSWYVARMYVVCFFLGGGHYSQTCVVAAYIMYVCSEFGIYLFMHTCTSMHTTTRSMHTCTYIIHVQWNRPSRQDTLHGLLTSIFHRFFFWDQLWRHHDASCVLRVLFTWVETLKKTLVFFWYIKVIEVCPFLVVYRFSGPVLCHKNILGCSVR